jgi:hypothetical protein
MKRILLLTLTGIAAVITLTSCCCTKQCSSGSALELFNGKDLGGWDYVLAEAAVPRDAVWSVKDGILICKGTPLGVLHTQRKFTNFRAVVEYRWAPGAEPGNSGILTRINGESRALPRCAEVQLKHGSAGDVLGLQGMTVVAGQPRFFETKGHKIAGDIAGVKKVADTEKPAGEWNHVEVLAEGGSYTVWMNGQQINQVTGVEVIAGSLGLQSEGGEIHFRRAAVTPLAD